MHHSNTIYVTGKSGPREKIIVRNEIPSAGQPIPRFGIKTIFR
jgi:hypothetical protein